MFSFRKIFTLLLVVVLVVCVADVAEAANYRKPPFNGSIFGKRNSGVEYDTGSKAAALCEIALEACNSWLPQDKK